MVLAPPLEGAASPVPLLIIPDTFGGCGCERLAGIRPARERIREKAGTAPDQWASRVGGAATVRPRRQAYQRRPTPYAAAPIVPTKKPIGQLDS